MSDTKTPLIDNGHDHDDKEEEQSILDTFINGIKSLTGCIINTGIVAFLIWAWIYTSNKRQVNFAVIHELSKDGYINITFRHDKFHQLINGTNTKDDAYLNNKAANGSLVEEGATEIKLAKVAHGNMPNITYLDDSGKTINEKAGVQYYNESTVDTNKTSLILSDKVGEATWEMLRHEMFDKTFILMIIFTISWTNWDEEITKKVTRSHVHADGSIHLKRDVMNVNPLRIFLNCSFGIIFVDCWAVYK